jgi:hypothetical protein
MEENGNDLEKLAWEALNEALEDIEIPDYVKINKNDDGTFSCELILSYNSIGSFYIYFEPSIAILKDSLQFFKNQEVVPVELGNAHSYLWAASFGYLFLKNFFAEMKETISNLNEYPLAMSELRLGQIAEREGPNKKYWAEKTKKISHELIENQKQRVKKKINVEIQKTEMPMQSATHLMGCFYEAYLPEWKKAKACYKKNKNFNNWEKMIAVSFEDLPIDLIKKLGDPDTYTAMPSSLALENAARMCGVKPNSLGLRALQKYLQQSREWIKENGEEKLAEEVVKFFGKSVSEVLTGIEVAALLGKEELHMENYPLIHQIIAQTLGDDINEIMNNEPNENNDERSED